MFVAAVAMIDSRAGAMVDTTGTQPGGIGAGFYPFWSAFVVFVCGAVIAYKSRRGPQGAPAYEGREGFYAVLKLVIPLNCQPRSSALPLKGSAYVPLKRTTCVMS